MAVGAPGLEYAAGELESLLTEDLLLGQPFGVAAKVPLEVRPAHLAPVGIQVLVAVPAIGDDDPRNLSRHQYRELDELDIAH